MRLRRLTNINEKLAQMNGLIIEDPAAVKEKWQEVFNNEYPLHLELGTGKGTFIQTMAQRNPRINFIGVERVPDIIYKAARKISAQKPANLRLIMADAEFLPTCFSPGEIERIYLNFSDPWPKKRHEKRRLTSASFLEIYKVLLKKGGEIFYKTDNVDFFEYSLQSLVDSGFSLQKITWDLHRTPPEDNVMTEYEQKFVEQGKPICRCEARK